MSPLPDYAALREHIENMCDRVLRGNNGRKSSARFYWHGSCCVTTEVRHAGRLLKVSIIEIDEPDALFEDTSVPQNEICAPLPGILLQDYTDLLRTITVVTGRPARGYYDSRAVFVEKNTDEDAYAAMLKNFATAPTERVGLLLGRKIKSWFQRGKRK
jgi:hypothetical protein